MRTNRHTLLGTTAAIAAAFALFATPVAAQSVDAPPADTAAAPPQPVEAAPPPVVVSSPAPTVDSPEAPAATGASASPEVAPAPQPTVSTITTTTRATRAPAPVAHTATRTTTTRTTSVAHLAAPPEAVASPVAANDTSPPAALPADTAAEPPIAASPPVADPSPAPQPALTAGVALLGLLALLIVLAGVMALRRRRRTAVQEEAVTAPVRTVEEPVAVEPVAQAVAAPIAASEAAVVATPTMLHRRDPAPVKGALPSNGAAVDLPAKMPDTYEERSALLDKMVNAKPDKANPFTDRRQRLHRARLIMQSLGRTFDREPRIDLSQYPNNWPELQRPYYEAA